MTRLDKTTKEKIKQYVLNCINNDEESLTTPKEKLQYAYTRFKEEFGHEIVRKGEFKAFEEYLMGLPFSFDFMNSDILKLAREWNQEVNTESQECKILNDWYPFITNQFFKLCKTYKVI